MAPPRLYLNHGLFDLWIEELDRRLGLPEGDEFRISKVQEGRSRNAFYHFLNSLFEANNLKLGSAGELLFIKKQSGKTPEKVFNEALNNAQKIKNAILNASNACPSIPLSSMFSLVRSAYVFLSSIEKVRICNNEFPEASQEGKQQRRKDRKLCPLIEWYLTIIDNEKTRSVSRTYLRTFEDAAMRHLGISALDYDSEEKAYESLMQGKFKVDTPTCTKFGTVTELIAKRSDVAIDQVDFSSMSHTTVTSFISAVSFLVGTLFCENFSAFDSKELIVPRPFVTLPRTLDLIEEYINTLEVSTHKLRKYWLRFLLTVIQKHLGEPDFQQDRIERRVYLELVKDPTGVKPKPAEKAKSVTYFLVTKTSAAEKLFESNREIPESVDKSVCQETRRFLKYIRETYSKKK